MARHKKAQRLASEDRAPEGLINLSARYPLYDPGIDTRDVKRNYGKFGAVIHGLLLGQLSMPATIEDEQGNQRPWSVLVIELLRQCTAKFPVEVEPERVEVREAPVGERIILTKTGVIEMLGQRGLDVALEDHDNVYEVWIKPQVSATRDRSRSIWTYPEFLIGNRRKRKRDEFLGVVASATA